EVANFLFGGNFASRLTKRVRHKEGLAYGVGSGFGADARDKTGRFIMQAICNPKNIAKVDSAVADELQKLLKDGVTAEELAEAKKAFLAERKVHRSGDAPMAMQLSEVLQDGRTFAYHADLDKKIAGLTLDEVNAAIRRHWQPKKLVIVQAGDF